MFTDGVPSSKNDTTETEKIITTLKSKAKIFTVALCSKNKNVPGSDKNNIEWMKSLATDEKHAFNTSTASGLGSIFKTIQGTITHNVDITNATITDVIDSRFVIINDTTTPNTIITDADLADNKTVTLKNGGVVSLNGEGNQVVTWSEQTIPYLNEKKDNAWSRQITVRAKDEYIGGNNIPTNVYPDSKISTGYGDAILPQPTVNVKSDLLVNNKEVTIFYGDQIPTGDSIVNKLFNKAEPEGYVTQLDGTPKTVTYTIGSDGKNLKNEKGQLVNPNDFTLKWYSDKDCTKEIVNWADVNLSSDSSQYYYLKVTYNNLRAATDQSNTNTTKDKESHVSGEGGKITAHNSQDDKTRKYGVYTVKVISGQIQITKKLVKNKNNDPFEVTENDGQTFTFKVTKLQDESGTIKNDEAVDTTFGTNGSKEVTVTIPKGESQVSLTNSTELQNLPRGIYEVEEVNVPSFELTNAASATETNCYSTLESLKVRFSLGYRKPDGTNVINNNYEHIGGGQLGAAVYTNKLVTADLKLKKVDADNMKTLLKGAEFELAKWTVSENSTEGSWTPVEGRDKFEVNEEENLTALLPGRYKLTETKAPVKHALLGSSIYFKVESGKVLLTNEDGEVTPANNESSKMWTLAKEDNGGQVLTIKNTGIYSLPSTGGNGIYWYMISGMVLMSTAAWILYKNKCKEVLGK